MMCENITILDDRMQEMDEECCVMLMFVPGLPPILYVCIKMCHFGQDWMSLTMLCTSGALLYIKQEN